MNEKQLKKDQLIKPLLQQKPPQQPQIKPQITKQAIKPALINLKEQLIFFVNLIFTYQDNYKTKLMNKIIQIQGHMIQLSDMVGYNNFQLIGLYYTYKFGIIKSIGISLMLPLSICYFYHLLGYLILNLNIIYQYQVVMIGLRCATLAYLLNYSIHLSQDVFSWILYACSFIFAYFFPYNLIFITIYAIAIFLSYYKLYDNRTDSSIKEDILKEQCLMKQVKQISIVIEKPIYYVIALLLLLLSCFQLQKLIIFQDRSFYFVQLFFIGLLQTNQPVSIFYHSLRGNFFSKSHQFSGSLFALGFIAPNLHLKSLFLLFANQNLSFMVVSYILLHLPSLLMLYIYIGYREFFHSLTWKNMIQSMKIVSKSLVLYTVVMMLKEEDCHLNKVLFTSIVILTITTLYNLSEIFLAALGVFLIVSRACSIMYSNKITLQSFLCVNQKS